MKVLIVLNGVCRKKKLFNSKILGPLRKEFDPQIWTTEFAGHAELLALEGARQHFDVILSAGGDGTMHQVVNGVMAYNGKRPWLGLIPLGSGNDLARSLGVSEDVKSVLSVLNRARTRSLDIGIAMAHDSNGKALTRYFINECSMGMGPEVVRRVNEGGGRGLTAGLMYTKAIVTTFLSLKPAAIELKADQFTWSGKSRVLAVANGRAFGHGIFIAPNAKMDDARLNLFVAANPPLLRFLLLLQQLRRPSEAPDNCLTYREVTKVEVTSASLPVEADGEPIGFSPLTCELAATNLEFIT